MSSRAATTAPSPLGRHPHAARCRGESGILATVVVVPSVLLAFWLLLQFAIVMHVKHVAQAAAQDAASEAAAGGDGGGTASQLMAAAGAWITGYDVSVGGGGDHVTVVISADVIRVFPFGSASVEASGSAPIEEFIPQPERP